MRPVEEQLDETTLVLARVRPLLINAGYDVQRIRSGGADGLVFIVYKTPGSRIVCGLADLKDAAAGISGRRVL